MRFGSEQASGLGPKSSIKRGAVKIDFKTLTMMQLRNSPGEVLDRVARDGEVFVIERNGQPKACVVPVSFLLPDIAPERIAQELSKLRERNESHKPTINDDKELEVSFHETAAGENIVITVVLPHGYPNAAPRIQASSLPSDAPGRWPDGSLSIFGSTTAWNGRVHDVVHALGLARHWLKRYARWRRTGEWVTQEEAAS